MAQEARQERERLLIADLEALQVTATVLVGTANCQPDTQVAGSGVVVPQAVIVIESGNPRDCWRSCRCRVLAARSRRYPSNRASDSSASSAKYYSKAKLIGLGAVWIEQRIADREHLVGAADRSRRPARECRGPRLRHHRSDAPSLRGGGADHELVGPIERHVQRRQRVVP